MSISSDSAAALIIALADQAAGQELASAIENGSTLSSDTLYRLGVALGSFEIAANLQAAILNQRQLSASDFEYLKVAMASGAVAVEVGNSTASGLDPEAERLADQEESATAPSESVATPAFSPVAGSYGPTQMVSISCATLGASIYYTENGDTPTAASSLYNSAISVAASKTLKAIAVHDGLLDSAVASAAYVINGAVATPTFSPVAGSYGPTQMVTVSSVTAGATFYYTTNGSTPTTASTLYSGPISVASSQTLKVLGVKAGYSNSAVASAAYVINGAVLAPTFSPPAGLYVGTQMVTIASATSGATIYYTENGSTPTTSSTLYSGPVSVAVSETLKAIAVKAGYSDSTVVSAAYTIS